jgi:hypothetical protein
MKQTGLPLTFMALLLLCSLAASELAVPATANPDRTAIPLLSMPKEYVNYTISRVNGTWWAKIDGTYPIYISANSSCVPSHSLPMVYPTPPGTINIHVTLNEAELDWSNYTQTYPAALHHTAIGDWPMINCTITPLPDYFTLKIHYEHPLAMINGSYLFLYDLNISPYLSPQSPSSTAYFNVRTEESVLDLKAYTTETDSVWNPISYATSYENTTQVVAIQIQSEYSRPLLGDLVITFNENETPRFSSWTILILLILLAAITFAGLLVYFKKRNWSSEHL